LAAFVVLLVSSVLWFIYGFFVLNHNVVLVASSSTAFVLGVVILVGIVMYGTGDSSTNVSREASAHSRHFSHTAV
jgi:hypothetical protein